MTEAYDPLNIDGAPAAPFEHALERYLESDRDYAAREQILTEYSEQASELRAYFASEDRLAALCGHPISSSSLVNIVNAVASPVQQAESRRRILVEQARRRNSVKHGGQFARRELLDVADGSASDHDGIIALDDALTRLADVSPEGARLVELRYFAGLSMDEAAAVLDMSPRSAYSLWSYARSWLRRELDADAPRMSPDPPDPDAN